MEIKKWSDIYTDDETEIITKLIYDEIDYIPSGTMGIKAWWMNVLKWIEADRNVNYNMACDIWCFFENIKLRGIEEPVMCEKIKVYYMGLSSPYLSMCKYPVEKRDKMYKKKAKEWRMKKMDKIKQWREENKEELRKRGARYRELNRDLLKIKHKEYYAKNLKKRQSSVN